MTQPIGNGALFETDAKKRFLTATKDRYRLIELRNERKKLPTLPFSLDQFRAHVLSAMKGSYDGAIRCRYCGQVCDFGDVAIDHAFPLDRGGSSALENIEFPCGPCNDRKGEMLPAEFEKLILFLDREIPFAMTGVLKRLQVATKLQAGWAHNLGTIGELKKTGAWQEAGKRIRKRKAKRF